MKTAIIIGAGPAGLTAGYELLKQAGKDYRVIILEETDQIGGISRTVNYKGNRMDMGGHRLFSKVERVNQWWNDMLPLQGMPSYDDRLLKRPSILVAQGPDPEKTDIVMLMRKRISRIFFQQKFFDYPVTLNMATLKDMGLGTTAEVIASYLKTLIKKRPERSLEDFYINRFGKKLYEMFFEHYTENLWGRHPSQIDPSWGAQRVKGISISSVLKNAWGKAQKQEKGAIETSFIESFRYPKLGPGELWEVTAAKIEKMGGTIIKNAKVKKIIKSSDKRELTGVIVQKDNQEVQFDGDIFFSSMPLKDLVEDMNDVPVEMRRIARGLPYRDYITVGVLIPHLRLVNKTKIKTLGNIVPDDWIYVHDRKVKMGRLQIYNNWSPYMVKDPQHTTWLGLEYFCNEGDFMWNLSDTEFAKRSFAEMVQLNLIHDVSEVLDYHVERVKKAYPAYFDTYADIDKLVAYLNRIDNLFCIGRNGQHRYNNIDHSMCTAFEAVNDVVKGISDHENVWQVNTEKSYHEEK